MNIKPITRTAGIIMMTLLMSSAGATYADSDGLTYQWYKNGEPIPGANQAEYTIAKVTDADEGAYAVVVSNEDGETLSYAAYLTTIGNLSYQWYKDGELIPGATNSVLEINEVIGEDYGRYSVAVSNANGETLSYAAYLEPYPGGDTLTYQWYKDGTPIKGATHSDYTIRNATLKDAGSYYVTATVETGSVTSDTAQLDVAKWKASVIAKDADRLYGEKNPEFDYSIIDETGKIVNPGGKPALTTTAVETSPVGKYPINASAGTLDDQKYEYTFVDGTLVIDPAKLTISVNNAKVYDGTAMVSDHTQATANGLIRGDSLIAGSFTSSGSDAGSYSYPSTAVISTPFNTATGISNYEVTYSAQQMITPAPLIITVNDSKAFDNSVLVTDYTKAVASGLVAGDALTAGQFTTGGSEAGTYIYPESSSITVPFETENGISNYTVTYSATQKITSDAPQITFTVHGNIMKLTFTGLLYESDDAIHWRRVEGAKDTFEVDMTQSKKFYLSAVEN